MSTMKRQAAKYLKKCQPNLARLIFRSIRGIANGEVEGKDIKALKGAENQYRYRVQNIRVIYEKQEEYLIIRVIKVGPRGDVYK